MRTGRFGPRRFGKFAVRSVVTSPIASSSKATFNWMGSRRLRVGRAASLMPIGIYTVAETQKSYDECFVVAASDQSNSGSSQANLCQLQRHRASACHLKRKIGY